MGPFPGDQRPSKKLAPFFVFFSTVGQSPNKKSIFFDNPLGTPGSFDFQFCMSTFGTDTRYCRNIFLSSATKGARVF